MDSDRADRRAGVRWCIVLGLVGALGWASVGVRVDAQSGGEWLRPFPQSPTYWELVGRLFADTPENRRDRGLRGFIDPSVLAAGSLQLRVKEGNLLGTFVRFQVVQPENVLNINLPPDRLVTADVTQVLFGVANKDSLFLEVRTGNPSAELQQCVDGRHQRFGHLVDIRLQATMMCEGALFWTAWRRQEVVLDAASSGSMTLDNLGVLQVVFDRRAAELATVIAAPGQTR